MPGGRRLLGNALEFGRDPLALFQRAREQAMSIYRKLEVSSRSQAVARSRELGLLEG
jgi:hypothetical protein